MSLNMKLIEKPFEQIKDFTSHIPNKLSSFLPPGVRPFLGNPPSWFYKILAAQIDYYKPNVILNHAIIEVNCKFLKTIKSQVDLLVGQHAATQLPESDDLNCYDLFLSSFPPTLEWLRKRRIPAELLRLGFEPNILPRLKNEEKIFDVTFIGSLFSVHSSRISLLERLCDEFESMKIWGPKMRYSFSKSSIRRCYAGEAWGLDMFQIIRNSKIAINHHGDIPPFANNMRLFEATGVGTLLLTDWKENLHEMFEPGKEIVAYHDAEECIELIKYYLEHEKERETIASAGQRRTLMEHSYSNRMQEFLEIIKNYI